MIREDKSETGRKRGLTAIVLFALVAGMVGLSFAAVPLYSLFCSVTGYGGTTQRAEGGAERILDQTIVVRFDSTVSGDLPWTVKPEQTKLTLRIGETATMDYVAENRREAATVGTSTFNVSPPSAGIYFNKIECFCFTEQPLGAGETAEMPVVFYIDPEFAEDKDTRGISEITLSYTFFPADSDGADTTKPVAAVPSGTDRQPL